MAQRFAGAGAAPDARIERSAAGALPLALGGMLGAGLLVGAAPAALAAGWWLLAGVPVAVVAAGCCALASAHQSAAYRGPGAAHACTRARLGVVPARIGASAALAGQLAAMAVVARVAVRHAVPAAPPALAAVLVLLVVLAATAGLRIRGAAAWLWLGLSVLLLGVVLAACFAIAPAPQVATGVPDGDGGVGITGAAGLVFFGLLGFERLTAPPEERDRHRGVVVKRATIAALLIAGAFALLLGLALLHQLGPARLALSEAPVLDALEAADAGRLRPAVGLGFGLALLPVLLGALESFRSTAMAVRRDGDLPAVLDRTGSSGTPYLLDLGGGVVAAVLAVLLQPATAMAFAACCLLVHHALANAAARVLLADDQVWRMRSACLGMGLAVILAMSLPVSAMLGTLVVVITGPLVAGAISRRWS